MKPNHAMPATGGFTKLELLACAVTFAVLVGLFLPALTKTSRATRLPCIANIQEVGLAFRMWSNDHGEKFPWEISSLGTNDGTKEYALTGEVWRHFQAISNELISPKALACPTDKRSKVTDWRSFTNNSHLSYFVGLDADETKPQAMLSGDRNVTSSKVKPVNGVLTLAAGDSLEWTTAIHNKNGNIGLADGSVGQLTPQHLIKQLQASLNSTGHPVHRLALPE